MLEQAVKAINAALVHYSGLGFEADDVTPEMLIAYWESDLYVEDTAL